MIFNIDTKYRSSELEIMDDFTLSSNELIKTLNTIASINKLLGGNAITLNGVKRLLTTQPKSKKYSIVDLGCGNGDMLRQLAIWGKKNGYKLTLYGIDANITTLTHAKELSINYSEIEFLQLNVFEEALYTRQFDIVLSTLFLHHFTDEEINILLKKLERITRIGMVINDLQRSKLSYLLFYIIASILNNNMVKTDGLISILRGFKVEDLKAYSTKLKFESYWKWKWAFRYQWILIK